MRARIELVLAVAAAVGCVLSWLAASSTVEVAPVLDGRTHDDIGRLQPAAADGVVVSSQVAGVLAVLGVARWRRTKPAPK